MVLLLLWEGGGGGWKWHFSWWCLSSLGHNFSSRNGREMQVFGADSKTFCILMFFAVSWKLWKMWKFLAIKIIRTYSNALLTASLMSNSLWPAVGYVSVAATISYSSNLCFICNLVMICLPWFMHHDWSVQYLLLHLRDGLSELPVPVFLAWSRSSGNSCQSLSINFSQVDFAQREDRNHCRQLEPTVVLPKLILASSTSEWVSCENLL